MPKETPPDPFQKSDQPLVLPKGALSKEFRILTPKEAERLGFSKTTPRSPERKRETGISIEQAKEILGQEEVLGPEAVEVTFGFRPEDTPPIPFSAEELERAEKMGQMLVLRVEQTEDGKPMSLETMIDIIQKRWHKEGKGKLLYTDGDYKNWKDRTGPDFSQKAPRSGWALVSKELLPKSISKNYAQQTELMAAYLKDEVFKDAEIPEEYAEALEEWEQVKKTDTNIQELLRNPDNLKYDRQKAAQILSELKINQLTRGSIQETIYDLALYFDKNGKRLLPNVFTWSNSRSPGDYLVSLGLFDSLGIYGLECAPAFGGLGDRSGDLGASLSRRL